MARVIVGDSWFDDEKATHYEEDTYFDGNNHISAATGSQWEHERLYRTRTGKFVLNCWSQMSDSRESYEIIDDDQANAWLARNGHWDSVSEKYLDSTEI